MAQPLASMCKPRRSVFLQDRRATVLNLDSFLNREVDGEAFFQENYLTNGMETLIDRAFRHLAGGAAGTSVFHLSQAMGGGKTHSMMALGLLAREPSLRLAVLGDKNPAPGLGPVRVVGFNGRRSDVPFGIWGSIAEQLEKKDQFRSYYSPLSAPGPEAWRTLIGSEPIIVLLDELPPYMENAKSIAVGNSDLAVVSTTALANLMIAASDMPNAIVVLSDLGGGSYQDGENLINKSLANLKNETKRIALPITPVNPQGDELFHILRCRLFESLPAEGARRAVADDYRASHADAVKMGLSSSSSDGVFQNVLDA
jgi:predicted AAA+ superfamily ATPase